MFDAIPQQYHLFLGIGALVFLMLFVVSAAQKYQSYQYEKAMTVRRMLHTVQDIEDFMSKVDGCAIPKKILVSLHKETLARYMTIRHIQKNVDGIDARVSRAQQALQTLESRGETPYSLPNNRQLLDRYVAGMNGMINYLHNQRTVTGMNATEKNQFQIDISDIRAQMVLDFNLAEARGLAEQGMWMEAGKYMRSVMSFIQNHGPTSDKLNNLYQKANHYYKQIMVKQIPSDEPLKPKNFIADEEQNKTANPEISKA